MLTDWTAQAKDDQVQGHWTHTLSDDGKHMTLEIKEDVRPRDNTPKRRCISSGNNKRTGRSCPLCAANQDDCATIW